MNTSIWQLLTKHPSVANGFVRKWPHRISTSLSPHESALKWHLDRFVSFCSSVCQNRRLVRRMSCHYWGFNYPFRCIPLLMMEWSLSCTISRWLMSFRSPSSKTFSIPSLFTIQSNQSNMNLNLNLPREFNDPFCYMALLMTEWFRLQRTSQQRVPMLFKGLDNPQKLPSPWEDLYPDLMYGSLGPPESASRMTSWSVQPFLPSSWTCPTDRMSDQASEQLTMPVHV